MSLVVSAQTHLLNSDGRYLGVIPVGASLGEIVDQLCEGERVKDSLMVEINGAVVPKAMWDKVWPKDATRVDVIAVYRGGSSGGQILAVAAMLALSAVTFGVGGYVGLAAVLGGGSTLATAGIGIGITMLGGLAIGALFPPPGQEEAKSAADYYSLSGQGNSPRQDQGLMVVGGKIRVSPDVIGMPYSTVNIGDEDMTVIYGYGYKNVAIQDLMVGNVKFEDLQEAESGYYENFIDGNFLTYYPEAVHQEAMGQTVLNPGSTNTDPPTPPETDDHYRVFKSEKYADQCRIVMSFPEGFYETDPGASSGTDLALVGYWIHYRAIGTTPWIDINSLTYVLTNPSTGTFEFRLDGSSDSYLHIEGELGRQFNVGLLVTMPLRGEYEFRVGRSDELGQEYHTKTILRFLQTITNVPAINPPVETTVLEIKVKATDQLSGAIDNLSSLAYAHIPYRDAGVWRYPLLTGGIWDYPWTNNPAWVYLYVLMRDCNAHPQEEASINMQAFDDWAVYCEQPSPDDAGKPYLACNFALLLSSNTTFSSILQKIAACGNATPHKTYEGLHSILWDKYIPYSKQVFTQRNARNPVLTKSFIEQPHGLRVKFQNEDDDYKADEIIAYSPGYSDTNATTFEDFDAFGCTEVDQAHRSGLRYLAMGRLRSEKVVFDSDLEYLACERGTLINVPFTLVTQGNSAGRIVELIKTGTDITAVRMDQKHGAVAPITGYGLLIRTVDATGAAAQIFREPVNVVIDEYTLQFTTPILAISADVRVGDLVAFGKIDTLNEDYLVTKVVPGQNLTAKVECTPYAVEIFQKRNGGTLDDVYDLRIIAVPATGDVGQEFSFSAYSDASPIASYIWTLTGSSVPTSTDPIVNVTYAAIGEYSVTLEATLENTEVVTETVHVSVADIPNILAQPSNLTLDEGVTGEFIFAAENYTQLWWEVDSGNGFAQIPDSNALTLEITATLGNANNSYRGVAHNVSGNATTTAALLTVNRVNPPIITSDPIEDSVLEGWAASFTVGASGSYLEYQWQRKLYGGGTTWQNMAGETASSVSFIATSDLNYSEYRCIVSNIGGSDTSAGAMLTLIVVPD